MASRQAVPLRFRGAPATPRHATAAPRHRPRPRRAHPPAYPPARVPCARPRPAAPRLLLVHAHLPLRREPSAPHDSGAGRRQVRHGRCLRRRRLGLRLAVHGPPSLRHCGALGRGARVGAAGRGRGWRHCRLCAGLCAQRQRPLRRRRPHVALGAIDGVARLGDGLALALGGGGAARARRGGGEPLPRRLRRGRPAAARPLDQLGGRVANAGRAGAQRNVPTGGASARVPDLHVQPDGVRRPSAAGGVGARVHGPLRLAGAEAHALQLLLQAARLLAQRPAGRRLPRHVVHAGGRLCRLHQYGDAAHQLRDLFGVQLHRPVSVSALQRDLQHGVLQLQLPPLPAHDDRWLPKRDGVHVQARFCAALLHQVPLRLLHQLNALAFALADGLALVVVLQPRLRLLARRRLQRLLQDGAKRNLRGQRGPVLLPAGLLRTDV